MSCCKGQKSRGQAVTGLDSGWLVPLFTHTHTHTAQMPLGVRGGGGLLTSSLSPSLSFRIPCTVRGSQVCAGDREGHPEGEGQI